MTEIFSEFLNELTDPVLTVHSNGTILNLNANAISLLKPCKTKGLIFDQLLVSDHATCNKWHEIITEKINSFLVVLKTGNNNKISCKLSIFKNDINSYFVVLKECENLCQNESKSDSDFFLFKNESRYQAIFENSMMGIIILDHNLIIQDFNHVFGKIAGFESTYLFNRELSEFIHPVEINEAEKLFNQIIADNNSDVTIKEFQLIRKDSSIRTATTYISSYYDDRLKQKVLLLMFDDISDKKKIAEELIKSEQKHRMIAEYVLDVIWISDLNLVTSFVSPSIYKFQGYTQDEFLKVDLDHSLIPESLLIARQKMAECYSLILSGEEKAADLKATMEIVYRHKNGSLVNGEVTAVFITDSKGNPTGILGVTRDVTVRKQHEADLMTAKDKAEEANRLKSMFLANVSHEIRTPVSGIIGLTSRLIKNSPDEFFHKQLTSIFNSAEMLLTIINDLLDVSRIEAGKLELENIEFDFRKMLSGVTDLFTHKIQEKQLYFHYAIDEKIPRIIQGDPVRIGQILINILGNAFKFTDNGGVELTVSRIRKKVSDRFGIKFSIADTGQGIAPEKVPLIFNAFTQADVSHTRKYGGTGLGLTIAGSLIDMMGGKIRVKSDIGAGSLFEYELFLKAVKASVLTKNISVSDFEQLPKSLDGLTVLIAEDNDLNSEYLKMFLEDYNIKVIACVDGEEAFSRFLENKNIDGMILDVQMPKMDGYQLAKAIRESNQPHNKIPLMGLSASGFPEEEKMAIESGMNQFMIKPAKEEKLLIWLNSIKKNVSNNRAIVKNTFESAKQNPMSQIFDFNELLNKNSQRLSSLLPLVQLMLDTGNSYIKDLKLCIDEDRIHDLNILAHKFKGRISIFDSNMLLKQLTDLENRINSQSKENLLAWIDTLNKSYQLFEARLLDLKQVIENSLKST